MKFHNHNDENEVETLIAIMAKLPGLGPRSARRAVIRMIEKKEIILQPLANILNLVSEKIKNCNQCGNFSVDSICAICLDNSRNKKLICIVQDVADLWAMERSQIFDGVYHVLGNYSSSYMGINLEELEIEKIFKRVENNEVKEIILALDATINGQTTANYIIEKLKNTKVSISSLAHGVPVGGELDYLDDGTIRAAFNARKPF
ncbi:MAG: recombination mediator RecR [Paracoccaceae bacterium]